MASKILKGLAVAAGAGLAIGFGGKRRSQAVPIGVASESKPTTDVVLKRLDRIEARMSAIEAAQSNSSFLAEPGLSEAWQKLTAELPALVETTVAAHIEKLQAQLQAETRKSVETTLISFERVIDTRVSLRLAPVEKAVVEQSQIITALSQRATESDANLQRLISAVERLCERPGTSIFELPFERHLSEAIKRHPEASESGFRPGFIAEDDEKPRHRTPLARI